MSGKRKSPRALRTVETDRLEDRVTAVEIQNAERFATIMTDIKHIKSNVSKLVDSQSLHVSQHQKTETQVSLINQRLGVVEKSYKSFHRKLWGVVIALIGSFGTGATALWNLFRF